MKKLKIAYIFAFFGVIVSCVSVFLPNGNCWSDILGMASTNISIILGLISIVYTYKSGESTLELFEEIQDMLNETKKQNRNLVDKINFELSKDNYDQKNIDNVRKNLK